MNVTQADFPPADLFFCDSDDLTDDEEICPMCEGPIDPLEHFYSETLQVALCNGCAGDGDNP